MPVVTTEQLRELHARTVAEIARLVARRDTFEELLGLTKGTELPPRQCLEVKSQIANASEKPTWTQQIHDLLARRPGLTKKQITDELAGIDRDKRRVVYNTAHSLARRGKVAYDTATGRLSPRSKMGASDG